MAVNYDKLWKLLDSKQVSKSNLRDSIGASQSTIVRMGKNEFVSLEVIDRICKSLNCYPEDIVGYVPDPVGDDDENSSSNTIKRGDVYYADLSDGTGSNQVGVRPVLIVQNDVSNNHSSMVIIVSMSSQVNKFKLPTHVDVKASDETCLTKETIILCEQFHTISKTKLTEKIGAMPDEIMHKVDIAMKIALNLSDGA